MMHDMHGPWMFFQFFQLFWIFPLAIIGFFLIVAFLVARRLLSSTKGLPLPEKEKRKFAGKVPPDKIPGELKEAGRQVLENLDWETRFLERQRLEVKDPKERKKIEEELRHKREEYQATVNRLEL